MIPAIVLAATIYAGMPVTVGPRIEWASMAPAVNDSGSCRFPTHKASNGDSCTVHWRVFRMIPGANFTDDSVLVSRSDTIRVAYPVTEIKYYIRYSWASRIGMSNGPKELFGCARSKLLVPVVP